ncbi:hypothetical protein [Actinomadura sp. NBRC 104425]|uniref:hypothetical protein n=1 Tax=Actinomadura sp. NBRC 104425 TaxID=3032204 RepID=UPI0025567180|nr:hypothetical protein [Actinomadura sp. NBRC 104425]
MAVALTACTGEPETQPTAQPDLRPVHDVAPYLCDLVPETEFRRVTGLTMPLDDQREGPQTSTGTCVAHAAGRQPPLGVQWDFEDGDEVLRRNEPSNPGSAHRLPADMGIGFARRDSITPRPNYVISLFRCGDKRPWLRLDFAPVVRGRDAVQDMFAFMRIAQKRFGQIHKCEPRPS